MQRWILGEVIGVGSMSRVFAVQHARSGAQAALKLGRQAGEEAREQQTREIRALARVDHGRVIPILDHGVVQADDRDGFSVDDVGATWLVMPRMQGLICPRSSSALLRLIEDVLEGVMAIHGAGLLHLDLKPSNILSSPDGRHAVADLGVAMSVEDLMGAEAAWGSLPYLAPERFDGRHERLTTRTDVYAVGCLAWQLATGAPPFEVDDAETAARAHRSELPPLFVPRLPVPLGFERWLRKCLEKRPLDRFDAAAQALEALRSLGEGCTQRRSREEREMLPCPTLLTATVMGEAGSIAELAGGVPCSPTPVVRVAMEPPRPRKTLGASELLALLPLRLVGRESSLDVLWGAVCRVAEGQGARWVISGPSRVGKSRLGAVLTEEVRRLGIGMVLTCLADDDDEVTLARWLGLPRQASIERVLDAIQVHIGERPVLEQPTLVAVAQALATKRLVVLWLDDLHQQQDRWEALGAVSERALVLGASHRPVGDLPCVPLEPLPERHLRTALGDWVGLDPRLVADLIYRCENDLELARSTLLAAHREGRLVEGNRGLRADGTLPLVGTVTDRALPEAAFREALDVAVAAGRSLPWSLWCRLAPEADSALAWLEQQGVAARVNGELRWNVPQARHTWLNAYRDRLEPLRHRVAEALEPVDPVAAAKLWLELGLHERAATLYLPLASDRIATGGMAEAHIILGELDAAMDREGVDDDRRRVEVWQARGDLGPTHQGYEAIWRFREQSLAAAARHADDPTWDAHRGVAAGGMCFLGDVQLWPNRVVEAEQDLWRLVEEGRAERSRACDLRGWLAVRRGHGRAAMAWFDRCLSEGATGRFALAARLSRIHAAVLARAPGRDEALEAGQADLESMGFWSAEADLLNSWADHLRAVGDLRGALERSRRAMQVVGGGEVRADPGTAVRWALALGGLGEHHEAVAVLEKTRGALTDEGPGWEGEIDLHLARLGAVIHTLDEALLARALANLHRAGVVDHDLLDTLAALAPELKGRLRVDADTTVARMAVALKG